MRTRTKYELSFVTTAYNLPVEFGPVRFIRKSYSLVVERVLVHVSVLLLVQSARTVQVSIRVLAFDLGESS